jgi:hypothetical protein
VLAGDPLTLLAQKLTRPEDGYGLDQYLFGVIQDSYPLQRSFSVRSRDARRTSAFVGFQTNDYDERGQDSPSSLLDQELWEDDEVIDQDWVGEHGAVGEKSLLHMQSSLPTKSHRGMPLACPLVAAGYGF